MTGLVIPAAHLELVELLNKTWNTRLEVMAECSCVCYKQKADGGFSTLGLPPHLPVHALCGRPYARLLGKSVNECDNCERWYISDALPDRWLLCPDCR
jgi:hypothetical protein